MLPMRFIRHNLEQVKAGLSNKGFDPLELDRLVAVDARLREKTVAVERLKAERNLASDEVARLKREGQSAQDRIAELGELTGRIKVLDRETQAMGAELEQKLIWLPNLPHASTPVGTGASHNQVVASWGDPVEHAFDARDQVELLASLQLVDFAAGARIAGKGFPLYTDRGARLERALINFMLDLHTREHGYTEIYPPFLSTRRSITTTGQLPKLEEDMYLTTMDDLFLIPTAEVPLTNIHQESVLSEDQLPVKYAAFSACFRREAGSYGQETKGLLRVHQFNKVELVKFVHPDSSYEELETLRADAEAVLRRLGLAYRVVELCTGDLSFAAAKCYDLELHAPVTGKWLEVSSCSNFEAFQARRGRIRFRRGDSGKPEYVHTLNGSGVATPRLMVALIESCQQADGSLVLPEALVSYYGAPVIEPL
ncbi:MAG: serine--tRNA ligase [Candidatus Marinimicrobia bacterium]|nr:serine--tRNA ligase [Candidatus Neomarinimicrobiota bacterium]